MKRSWRDQVSQGGGSIGRGRSEVYSSLFKYILNDFLLEMLGSRETWGLNEFPLFFIKEIL